MAKVIAPKGWKHVDKRCGVDFKDGVGRTSDDRALAFFRRQGYQVDEGSRRSREDRSSQPNSGDASNPKGEGPNGSESGKGDA